MQRATNMRFDLQERRGRRALRASRIQRAAQAELASRHPPRDSLNEKSRCAKPEQNLVGVPENVWTSVR